VAAHVRSPNREIPRPKKSKQSLNSQSLPRKEVRSPGSLALDKECHVAPSPLPKSPFLKQIEDYDDAETVVAEALLNRRP
jgi:hypothetical protein